MNGVPRTKVVASHSSPPISKRGGNDARQPAPRRVVE